MRVGFFISQTNPIGGGGYTFVNEIVQSLNLLSGESHHEFIILSEDSAFLDESKISTAKLRLAHVKNPFFLSISRNLLYSLLKGVFPKLLPRWRVGYLDAPARKLGIDFLVFFGGYGNPPDIPYAFVIWDLEHRVHPWFPEVSARGLWDNREFNCSTLIQRATYLITGTKVGREQVEFFYRIPQRRIRILPHPTPCLDQKEQLADRISLLAKYELEEDFLLYPANFWAHKNHVNLLLALNYLREHSRLNLKLVLTGYNMGNEPYIRKFVTDLRLDDQVAFLGFISKRELIALYEKALALTYVSFGGPENLPPLEAFAVGCPVIAADVPGADEQLGDAAILVDPKSPEQIAAAIKKLYDDSQLRDTLITKGKQRALRFTGHDFVRGLFAILDEFESIRRCWPSK